MLYKGCSTSNHFTFIDGEHKKETRAFPEIVTDPTISPLVDLGILQTSKTKEHVESSPPPGALTINTSSDHSGDLDFFLKPVLPISSPLK